MQTFLPYASFKESAKALDYRRLGKQRVEVLQLLNSIKKLKNNEPVKGWRNHPVRKMWYNDKGDYTNALCLYGLSICKEWKRRGYKDTCTEKIEAHFDKTRPVVYPGFVNDARVHLSHRSNLIKKDNNYYKDKFKRVGKEIEYFWSY